MTSASIFPKNRRKIGPLATMHKSMTVAEMAVTTNSNWFADSQARFLLLCPRYCDAITAPPVASAENTVIASWFTISTKETPETAASPTWDTMTVSQRPTKTARICSKIKGMINFLKSSLLNKYIFITSFATSALHASMRCQTFLRWHCSLFSR